MIGSTSDSRQWIGDQRRWADYFVSNLAVQLRSLHALARSSPPQALRQHVESFLTLLAMTESRAQLAADWLALVDALHPLPVRWGYWSPWLAVLQQAAQKAANLNRSAQRVDYLTYLADLYQSTGHLDEALTYAHEAIELAERIGAIRPLGMAGGVAASSLRAQARFAEAQAILDRVRRVIDTAPPTPDPSHLVVATGQLDLEQMDLDRYFKRPDKALALGESLINRLESADGIDPHFLADAYRRRATLLWVSARYPAAVSDLQRAAELFREGGDALQATFTEGNLGLVYYSMSRYDQAEELMLAAARAAEEVNARQSLVSSLGDLSVVYIALGRMERACEVADRMVTLAVELGNEAELSRGRSNRGYTLLALGRYGEAREDLEFGLNLYQSQGRLEGTISTSVDYVSYLQGVGRHEDAAALAQRIYDDAQQEDFPHLHVVTTRCLAQFKPPVEREALLRYALQLAIDHERPMDEAGCLFSLAAIAPTPEERTALFRQGRDLVRQMGCMAWLVGKSAKDPPMLPMTI